MSGFNTASFEATVQELSAGVGTVQAKVSDLNGAVNTALTHPLVSGWVADALTHAWNVICEAATSLLEKIGEFLQGVAAPILFYKRSFDWIDDVKTPMVDLADAVGPSRLITEEQWTGQAHAAYLRGVESQAGAATAIGAVGGTMAVQLAVCATAGLAFYVALGVIVVKFIAALVAGIAACGTIALSPLGLGVIALDAGVSAGLIIAAVSTLVAALGAQANAMVQMKSALADFPGAQWPTATN